MKIKSNVLLAIIGGFLISGGFFMEFTDQKIISTVFERPDLVSIAVIFSGLLIGLLGVTNCMDEKFKTKLQRIEENDERNIKLNNYAKSKAFDFMSAIFSLGLLILALLGYMNKVSFFSLAGFYILVQIYFLYQRSIIQKVI